MITRLSATLESIEHSAIPLASLTPEASPFVIEAMLPTYLAQRLEPQIGTSITLHTRTILEAQGQGTSFIPRLIGFGSADERAFFETFTSVKGVGTRKALRALAEEPGTIAALIVAKDAKALTKLPEIGKRLAETIIAELSGKIDRFAADLVLDPDHPRSTPASTIEPALAEGPIAEAVAALVALGETRTDAIRKVERASAKLGDTPSADTLISAVFAGV